MLFVVFHERPANKPIVFSNVSSRADAFAGSALLATNSQNQRLSTPSTSELAAIVLKQLQAWDDDDDPALRVERLQKLDKLLSGTDAMEIVQSLPSDLSGYAFATHAFREKLMANPRGTLDWMSQNPNVQSQLLTFLQDWNQTDRTAMLQAVNDLPNSEWKQKVLSAAVNESLFESPSAAMSLAAQLDNETQRSMWRDMTMTEWAKQDPNAALGVADETSDPVLRGELFSDVAAGMADSNPQEAIEFAFQTVTDPQVLNRSFGDIVSTWAMRDPVSAADWLLQLPDNDLQRAGLQNLMSVWGNRDPGSATLWIENLPPDPFQAKAARDLLSVFQRGN